MSIRYNPPKDELSLLFPSVTAKHSKTVGRFKISWDNNGRFSGLSIRNYRDELKELWNKATEQTRVLYIKQLRGKYRNILISSEDFIREKQKEIELEDKKYGIYH